MGSGHHCLVKEVRSGLGYLDRRRHRLVVHPLLLKVVVLGMKSRKLMAVLTFSGRVGGRKCFSVHKTGKDK